LPARRSGAFKEMPLDPAGSRTPARWVIWKRSGRDKKSNTLLSGPVGTRDQAGERGCRTMGCERGRLPMQVATRLRRRRGSDLLRIQGEKRCRKTGSSHCVCEQRWCAWGVVTAEQSSFSQLKLSVVPGESNSSPTSDALACRVVVNAFQQYERLLSLATAKRERKVPILELAHPPISANPDGR
jgi:hypothetical protein